MDSIPESSTQDIPSNSNEITEQTTNELENPQEEPKGQFFSDTDDENDENDLLNDILYEKILSERTEEDGSISYLVKIPHISYHHLQWIPEKAIFVSPNSKQIINEFKTSNQTENLFDPNYLQIEKLITFRVEPNGTKSYLTKWCNLDYQNLTWEPESEIPQNLIFEFTKSNQIPDFKDQFLKQTIDYTKWKPFDVPQFTPNDYQINDLNYIAHSFCHEQNVILSYEFGLGSSIECCMFLKWITENQNITQPFLIIATEKRIEEFKNSLKLLDIQNFQILTFTKPKIQRDVIANYELFYPGTKLGKSNIVLTNYSVQAHNKILSEIHWHTIFLDVAHIEPTDIEKCLTNDFFHLLSKFECNFTILICNTFNDIYLKHYYSILFKTLSKLILNFIGKAEPSTQAFLFKSALHSILLKRTKASIMTSVHKYTEYLIDCSLSETQYDFYICVYQKYLNYVINNSNGILIDKIFTELHNLCTHPYLNKGTESDILLYRKEMGIGQDSNFSGKSMIDVSTKMKILDLIVKENIKRKSRLIILSHQESILDIVQDYFTNKDISFRRLGFNTRGQTKASIIKKFNMIGSLDFAILIYLNDAYTDSIKLSRVETVVIMDSNWNPKKDISDAISIANTEKVSIYRLLAFGTIERAMYDLALMKLGNTTEQLSPNQELTTLIGFGFDPLHPIAYENDKLDTILNRSLRNCYDDVNQIELSHNDTSKNEIKEDPWSKYAPILSIEHFTQEANENQSTNHWTIEKLLALENGLIGFGWGRWQSIVNNDPENLSDVSEFEVEALCHMLMDFLLKCEDKIGNAQSKFSISINIIKNWTLSERASLFQKQFGRENQNLEINQLIQNSTQKLLAIEFMHFVNAIVTTCPKVPEQIVVPYIEPTFDGPWDENADRYLIYHIYQNGYMRFGQSEIPPQLLEFRAKMIIDTLKSKYIIYHELRNGSSKFEHFSLVRAVNMLTSDEQQAFVHTLIYFGWTTPEEFKKISGSYRTEKEITIIHKIIIDFCKGHNEMINDLAESIPKHLCKLILNQEQLLYNVRNNLNKEQVSAFDWPIVNYVKNNGLICVENCDEIRNRFGTDFLEYKVSHFLRKFFQKLQHVSSSAINFTPSSRMSSEAIITSSNENKPHVSHPRQPSQINVDYDANGNPIMPLQILPSLIIVNLGEIVTDRPNFYNSRYIYPKGYESLKLYRSPDNPNDRAWYQSLILDDGTDSPLFRVQLKDNPAVHFDGRAPSKPWLDVLKIINDKKKEFGLPISKNVTVSGPEYYGFAVPIVQALIQKMKGADICINYGKVELPSCKVTPQPSLDSIPKPPPMDEISSQSSLPSQQQTEEDLDTETKITHNLRNRKHISYADSTDEDDNDDENEENDAEFVANQKDDEINDDETFHFDKEDKNDPFEKEDDDDEIFTQPKKNSRSSKSKNTAHSQPTSNQPQAKPNDTDSNTDSHSECIIQ